MALGLQTTSGNSEISDRIEYDAKAGRFFRVDRSQGSDGIWLTNKVELKTPLTLVVDLDQILIGYMKLDKSGVDFSHLVALGESMGPRPEGVDGFGKPTYKQGFQVRVFSLKLLGGVRQWSHTAKCVIGQMDALHSQFVADGLKNPGKVPVITFNDPIPVKVGQSTNYAPVAVIEKWTDRPEALNVAPKTETPKPAAVASTGSGHTPPPATKAAETADMEPEFA